MPQFPSEFLARPAWSVSSSSRCSRIIRGSRSTWLGASERSEGKAFRDAAAWRLPNRLPDDVANRVVEAAAPGNAPKLMFSGLDSSVAGEIEAAFAQAGHIVVSNSRNYRMFDTVPLLIPEVNADHLAVARRAGRRRRAGRAASSPTRTARPSSIAMALAPLRQFGIETTMVTTLQAISGAGYPGVPSWDILGNIIPYIGGGEEEKIETETRKILGALGNGKIDDHPVTRERDGDPRAGAERPHRSISVALEQKPTPEAVIDAWSAFRGRPQELNLPTAPPQPVVYLDEAEPAAAAARRQSRRRHDGQRRTPAALPALRLQVHGARSQHDPRRRRRGDSERRTDAGARVCCERHHEVRRHLGRRRRSDDPRHRHRSQAVRQTTRPTGRRSSSCRRCPRSPIASSRPAVSPARGRATPGGADPRRSPHPSPRRGRDARAAGRRSTC